MEKQMLNQLKKPIISRIQQFKEDVYTKATAIVGIAAVMGLAFILGMQQKTSHRR